MTKEYKLEDIQEDLLLELHKRYPITIDDNAILFLGDIGYEKGKAHGCIYSGKASIINKKKGIELDFSIWFSAYCDAYEAPEIKPDIESYITGKYHNVQRTSENIPELGLKAVILLNKPEVPFFSEVSPLEKRYFDAYWHVFETSNGNRVLYKEGWFNSYVYDTKLGMRPTTEIDWIEGEKPGWRQIRDGLKLADSDDVKNFVMMKYKEGMNPEMYVAL